jgi:histidinol-phosphate aminotransferase
MSERDYRRPPLRSFTPYVVGKPIEEVKRELGIQGPIAKLASNENPLGPSPKALEAIRGALEGLHMYPDDNAYYFKQAAAEHHGVSTDMIFSASGSVEVIELCGTCLLEEGDEVLTSERTFAIYYLATKKAGAELVVVPMPDGYRYDLEAILAAVTPRTKIIFLANPTNPTGTWFTAAEFDAFMERVPEGVLVVYDAAYHPYCTTDDMPDPEAWLARGRDVLVLYTFSKAHGLAGIRAGYGLGPARIIAAINQGRFPFNMSIPAQLGAIAALGDHEHISRSRAYNQAEIAFLLEQLADLPVTIPPSQTNFILIDTPVEAKGLFVELQKRGIIVRPMGGYGMPNAIRVSPGTHEENQRFVAALRELIG